MTVDILFVEVLFVQQHFEEIRESGGSEVFVESPSPTVYFALSCSMSRGSELVKRRRVCRVSLPSTCIPYWVWLALALYFCLFL